MSNNKINNISNSTNNSEAIDKQYVDTGFLKLSGGAIHTITGRLYLPTNSYVSGNETLNLHQMKGFFIIEQDNPYVEARFNMANNKHDKIINLNVDYQLWHKSRISIDMATSKRLTIGNVAVKK